MRVLIGRSSKVIVPAAAETTSSNLARRDSPPLVKIIRGNSDQVGCFRRTWKRSGSFGDSNASSVSSSAPAAAIICRLQSSIPWQTLVTNPSPPSKAAMATGVIADRRNDELHAGVCVFSIRTHEPGFTNCVCIVAKDRYTRKNTFKICYRLSYPKCFPRYQLNSRIVCSWRPLRFLIRAKACLTSPAASKYRRLKTVSEDNSGPPELRPPTPIRAARV